MVKEWMQNSEFVVTILPLSSPRYRCNQCPYRSYRMDQLNSHKLRHQAKSLMCEICAYACKRKYELHSHMLTKHSGDDKLPSVYKCKYCTYRTCYRQALQNHENCKHTKLKEYRCALCVYSSFSGISLFLHKRKAHGYVPGDKAWLENYAAKEKERNLTEFSQGFYNKTSTAQEQLDQSTSGEPPPSQREQPDCLDLSEPSKETVMDVFDVVSQEVVNDSPSSVNSPEEYCTLVLTTLPTSDYPNPTLQNEEENDVARTPSNLNCNGSDTSRDKAHCSTASSEENDVAVTDAECEQRDPELLNNTSQPIDLGESQTGTSEAGNDGGTMSSTFPSERNQQLKSELRLKAMKKHDKDQAEAMVMEGRVQMLVVPTKDVYRCDKCSYITSKESTLNYHCQSLCHGRIKVHKCQACGAQFKQKRGLESHLAKKCPALRRKIRTFVGISNTRLATEDNSTVGQEESKQPDEGTDSDPTDFISSPKRICTDSNHQEFKRQEAEVYASHLTNSKGVLHDAPTSSESEHKLNKAQTKKLLNSATKE